jgi:hypothetical protein
LRELSKLQPLLSQPQLSAMTTFRVLSQTPNVPGEGWGPVGDRTTRYDLIVDHTTDDIDIQIDGVVLQRRLLPRSTSIMLLEGIYTLQERDAWLHTPRGVVRQNFRAIVTNHHFNKMNLGVLDQLKIPIGVWEISRREHVLWGVIAHCLASRDLPLGHAMLEEWCISRGVTVPPVTEEVRDFVQIVEQATAAAASNAADAQM